MPDISRQYRSSAEEDFELLEVLLLRPRGPGSEEHVPRNRRSATELKEGARRCSRLATLTQLPPWQV